MADVYIKLQGIAEKSIFQHTNSVLIRIVTSRIVRQGGDLSPILLCFNAMFTKNFMFNISENILNFSVIILSEFDQSVLLWYCGRYSY